VNDDDLDPDATFVIRVTHNMAWTLSQRIRPGPSAVRLDRSTIEGKLGALMASLRHKVNDALLRFRDETRYDVSGKWVAGPREIELTITTDEGWLIDNSISFDGIGGEGYDLLLRVLAGMTDLPWELRISGRSVDRRFAGRLESLARRGGLGGRVRFLGELHTELLAGEYRRAQVFVFPSRYEGYGISLAEAAFAGLPFVAFAVGAVAEAVRGGGLLAAPDDLAGFGAHLRRLIAEPAFRQEQAVLSREVARGLPRWQDTGRAFQAALESACG